MRKKRELILRMCAEDFLAAVNKENAENQVNRYMLCNAVAKRARQLTDERRQTLSDGVSPAEAFHNFKPVSEALLEFYSGSTMIIP